MDVQLVVSIGIGGILIVISILALREIAYLRTQPQKPGVTELLIALQKYIYTGILAGEKLVLAGEQALDAQLIAVDKAAVANSIYDALPEVIMVGTVPVPLTIAKTLVTREMFAGAVKTAYDEAHAFILRNEAYLTSQVEAAKPTGV